MVARAAARVACRMDDGPDGTNDMGEWMIGARTLRKAGLAIAVFGALAGALALTGCLASGIKVLVVNGSGGAVHDMKISYTGGTVTIPQLAQGASHTQTIHVEKETDLSVELTLAGGEKKTQSIRAQLEPGYVGNIRLEVVPSGGISWEKELSLKGGRHGKGKLVQDSPH